MADVISFRRGRRSRRRSQFRRRARQAGLPLVALLALVAAVSIVENSQTDPSPGPISRLAVRGLVEQVVDGDTIRVFGHEPRIRIFGIDAAEMDTVEGRRARDAMMTLVAGRDVTCRIRDRDRYGRTVAICRTANGIDIGGAMIARGHATEYCRYSGDYYGSCG